jgi:hypothetical protein
MLCSMAFNIIMFVMILGLAMEIVITNVERTQPLINAPPPYGGPRTYISVSANALVDFGRIHVPTTAFSNTSCAVLWDRR